MHCFAIIPAAGRSERMGRPKLLLPWRSSTIIDHVLSAWRASRVTRVVIVVHPLDDEIAEIGRRLHAIVVQPKIAPAEMRISVGLALASIAHQFQPEPGDAWLVAPADMPLLTASTIDRVIETYEAMLERGETPRICSPTAAGRRGHPVLFPWSLAAEVARLGPGEGLRAIVERNPVETVELGESAIFDDLDTPEDYERLRTQYGA